MLLYRLMSTLRSAGSRVVGLHVGAPPALYVPVEQGVHVAAATVLEKVPGGQGAPKELFIPVAPQ
jgi:hypothetical protein